MDRSLELSHVEINLAQKKGIFLQQSPAIFGLIYDVTNL